MENAEQHQWRQGYHLQQAEEHRHRSAKVLQQAEEHRRLEQALVVFCLDPGRTPIGFWLHSGALLLLPSATRTRG